MVKSNSESTWAPPDPVELLGLPVPEGGQADGSSNNDWHCCRDCLMAFKFRIEATNYTTPNADGTVPNSDHVVELLYFLDMALSNHILPVTRGVLNLDNVEYVICVIKAWINGDGSKHQGKYWFAREQDEERYWLDTEQEGLDYIEMDNFEYNSLKDMVKYGEREDAQCRKEQCAGIIHYFQLCKKHRTPIAEMSSTQSNKTARKKRQEQEKKSKEEEEKGSEKKSPEGEEGLDDSNIESKS